MKLSRLFHVLVVTGASSTALGACGGDDTGDDEGEGGAGGATAGAGGTAGGGTAGGGTGGTAGAQSGGAGGSDAGAGGAAACDCAEPDSRGWVFCNGTCCWLPNDEPCCE